MPALQLGMRVRVDFPSAQRDNNLPYNIQESDVGIIVRDPERGRHQPRCPVVRFDKDVNGWGPGDRYWMFRPHHLLPIMETPGRSPKRTRCPRLTEKELRQNV